MKNGRSVVLTLSLVFVAASAAQGQQLFTNFPLNGQISAFQVNGGYSVSESFTLTAGATLGEVSFGAWLTPGDSVTGAAWSIGTTPFGASSGSGVAGATSSFNFSNADGFDVNTVTFAIPGLTLPAGTYYLTLSAATSAAAKAVYWDIGNAAGGDSWDSSSGHVSAGTACFDVIGISGTCASSFQILSTGTALSSSPSSLTFVSQTVKTTSAAQGITITNNGPGAATIAGIAVTGANAGDFNQTNNCPLSPATLAANAFCTINVAFTPQAGNMRSAAISLTGSSPLSLALSGTGVSPGWPNGYTYQATFTVAAGKVPSAQTNFPALISGTFPDLATAANGGRISNTCTQTAGNNSTTVPCDLIFTSDAAGTTPLSWEFESYTAATGAVSVWVNAPNLANGTVIYAWYGQSSVTTLQTTSAATWSGNFEAVYHLRENPAGAAPQMNDSTANGNHATMNGPVLATQQQAGEIGGSLNFNGNTWASLANPANFSFERTDSFSLSGWFRTASNASGTLISKYPANQAAGWALLQFTGSSSPTFALALVGSGGTQAIAATPAVTTGAWHHVVATYSGSSTVAGMQIYVDGVNQALTTFANNLSSSIVNATVPVLNGRGGANQMSADTVDEIRISAKGVVFSPAWVTASYNNQSNPGAFFTASLGLINAGGPSVSLSSSSLTFASQTLNTTSAAQTITLNNIGAGALTIGSIGLSGSNTADFAQTNNCPISPATIATNGSCTINVTFTPQSAGTRAAAVTIADNAAGTPQLVGLSGTGATVPSTVTLSGPSLTFTNQAVKTASAAQMITLTNSGPGPLTVSGIAVTGSNTADFAQTNNCPVSPATIAANGFCTINVTFTPQAAGARSAGVSITDDGANSPQSVTLSGTGTQVPSTVTLSAPSLAFTNQTLKTTSAAQMITLTNSGPGALTVGSIAVTGSNTADFAQTNNCPVSPATIAANGFCTINVTFTPQAVGARSAAISITDDGANSPQSVSLSGTGAQAPSTVTLSAPSLTFTNQIVKTASAAQMITLTNSGPGALTVGSIAVTGSNTADFAQTNNCPINPATMAPNAFCTINVTFTPQAVGARSAAISITDDGANSPQSLSLSGIGTASAPVAWPNGYTYQATFTVAAGKVTSAQANFPTLISGTFPDLATAANGGKISNTCAQIVGNNSTMVPCDLIFTSDAAGATPLSWEFESYTAATGAVSVWVNAPNLANGTVIYAWYGQPSVTILQTTPAATWGVNFEAVYHLKENPAGVAPQMNDSTANANHATMNGAVQPTQLQAGEIGGSLNFSGNTWAGLANPANFSFERTDSFSLSGWFKIASNSAGTLISKFPANQASGWALVQFTSSPSPTFALALVGTGGTQAIAATPAVSIGAWHHVVATYSGTSTVAGMQIYVDGVNQTLTTYANSLSSSIVNATTPAINGRGGPTQMSTDTVDEIRISAKGVVFSPAWVTTSFNNQSNPGAFFTVATGLTNH